MGPKLIHDWLDAQHQKLIAQMEPEFQIGLRSNLTEKIKGQPNQTSKRQKTVFTAPTP